MYAAQVRQFRVMANSAGKGMEAMAPGDQERAAERLYAHSVALRQRRQEAEEARQKEFDDMLEFAVQERARLIRSRPGQHRAAPARPKSP